MMARRMTLLFSHHIYSSKELHAMKALAKEHRLKALVEVGRPGVILLEGEEEDVEDAAKEILHMRWQHILEKGMAELSEKQSLDIAAGAMVTYEKMSQVADAMRHTGLEAWYAEVLKSDTVVG